MKNCLKYILLPCIIIASCVFLVLISLESREDILERNHEFFTNQVDYVMDFARLHYASTNSSPYYEDPILKSNRTIFIGTDIGRQVATTVIKKLLYLKKLDNNKPITIYISTDGGELSSTLAIVDVIKTLDVKVNTIAMGNCYSAGTYLLAAGTGKRKAFENTVISVHINIGAISHGEKYDNIPLYNKRVKTFWKRYIPNEWFSQDSRSYYLSPKQAKEFGIIDEIIIPTSYSKPKREDLKDKK